MTWIKQRWLYVTSALFVAMPVVFAILARLGDADTLCSIVQLTPDRCGSGPLILFLTEPPAWFLSLGLLVGLLFFAWGERKRERIPSAKLVKLHDDFWELSASMTQHHYDTTKEIAAILSRLDEMEAALNQKASIRSVQMIPQGYKLEVKTAAKELSDQIGFLRGDLEGWQNESYSRFRESVQQLPSETMAEWIAMNG